MRLSPDLEWIAETWAADTLRNIAIAKVEENAVLDIQEKAAICSRLRQIADDLCPVGRYSQRGNLNELICHSDKLTEELS